METKLEKKVEFFNDVHAYNYVEITEDGKCDVLSIFKIIILTF